MRFKVLGKLLLGNPYVLGAIGAVWLGTCGYAAYLGYDYASSRCDAAKYREKVEYLETEIAIRDAVASADVERAKKDQAKIAELKKKIEEEINAVQDPDRECLTADDVERLRRVWNVLPE